MEMQQQKGFLENAIKEIDASFAQHQFQISQGGSGSLHPSQIEEMRIIKRDHMMELQDIEQMIKEQKTLLIQMNPKSSIMREKMMPAGPVGKPVLTMVPDYTPGVTYVDGKRVDASQHINKMDQTFVGSDLSAGFSDAELAAAVAANRFP